MSDEDAGKIEETFINKLGAKFPFIQAKGVNELFQIKFFPSVYVIDPTGQIHSVPEDRMPSEAMIEQLLAGVSLAPKLPDGAQYDPIRVLWQKGEHLKLRDLLTKMLAPPNLDAEMRSVLEAQQQELEKRSRRQVERVASLGQGPDYASAKDQLEAIEKKWRGLAPAETAKAELARFAGDATIKKELAASKALEKLLAAHDPNKQSQRKKLLEELAKFAKNHEGTHAGKQAIERRARLGG